jgi:hypothetical protein
LHSPSVFRSERRDLPLKAVPGEGRNEAIVCG